VNRRTFLAFLSGLPFAGLLPWKRERLVYQEFEDDRERFVRPILDRLQAWYDSLPRFEGIPMVSHIYRPDGTHPVRGGCLHLTREEIEEFDEAWTKDHYDEIGVAMGSTEQVLHPGKEFKWAERTYRGIHIVEAERSDLDSV